MKNREPKLKHNDSVSEAPKPPKESRLVEKKKERNKWLMAAFSAINLSGCGALNELAPGIGMLDWKPLDHSKLEQSDLVKTPQFKEVERTLRSVGYTDTQMEKFQSEYAHGCAYGETGGKKILSPVFSSQMLEGEMRLYAEKPTKMIDAGFTTEKEYSDLLRQEARDLTIRLGFSVKIVSNPAEANQIVEQVDSLKSGSDTVDLTGEKIGMVGGMAENLTSMPQNIPGLGTVLVAHGVKVKLSNEAFITSISRLKLTNEKNKHWVFNFMHRDTLEHEVLHNQGMMHTLDRTSIMFPSPGNSYKGEDNETHEEAVGVSIDTVSNPTKDPVTARMQGMKTFLDIKRSQHSNLNFLNADHI